MASQLLKVIMTDPSGHKHEALLSTHSFTIGRSQKNDFVVPDEALSRQHCRVEFIDGRFFITDLNSTNGIHIEGKRVPTGKRTEFNNYLPLQVSNYECQVSEIDPTRSMFIPLELATNSVATASKTAKTTKKLSFKNMSSQPPTVKRKNNNAQFFLSILISLGFVAFVYFSFYNKNASTTEVPTGEGLDASPTKPILKIPEKVTYKAMNTQSPLDYYVAKFEIRNCEKKEWCESLQLDPSKDEGYYQNDLDVMVFIRPELKQTLNRYQKLPANSGEIIAIDTLIGSQLMDEYYGGQLEHLQLVILSSDNRPLKVIRFHPYKFDPTRIPRDAVMKLMQKTMETGELKDFDESIRPVISIGSF